MAYYFTGFTIIFFLLCYGYSYTIVKMAKKWGDQVLFYGIFGGLFVFMAFCAVSVPVLHWLLDSPV
ncbi:MAG: hypothetical protein ACRC8A_11005 [Microcoleaceae cyanobacterium]